MTEHATSDWNSLVTSPSFGGSGTKCKGWTLQSCVPGIKESNRLREPGAHRLNPFTTHDANGRTCKKLDGSKTVDMQ
jgi:hypothetical protein